jgi:uncharacterized membrane protein
MFETRSRSLVKAVTWRAVAFAINFGVLYGFTGEAGSSLKITIVAEAVITAAYYIHERYWNRVHWGRQS